MSEHVDVVRDILDAFNRREVEAMVALAHPDIEITDLPDLPDAQTSRGHEGVRRVTALQFAAWESITVEVERMIDVGDQVVALVRNRGRGSGSGIEVVQPRGMVYGFRDGKVARVRFFADHATALEAAKQPEHS